MISSGWRTLHAPLQALALGPAVQGPLRHEVTCILYTCIQVTCMTQGAACLFFDDRAHCTVHQACNNYYIVLETIEKTVVVSERASDGSLLLGES